MVLFLWLLLIQHYSIFHQFLNDLKHSNVYFHNQYTFYFLPILINHSLYHIITKLVIRQNLNIILFYFIIIH